LPPAHCLTLAADQLHIRRYWQWPEAEIHFRSPRDTVAQFKTLFEQAIADRLRTDRVAVRAAESFRPETLAALARLAQPVARGAS
jgi:asparagine synthetase B (glutamine-hydrolysing)